MGAAEIGVEVSRVRVALLDRNFDFVRVNREYARALQMSESDFSTRNHSEFPAPDLTVLFDAVMATRKPLQVERRPCPYGSQAGIQVSYWDSNLLPFLGDDGEIDLLILCLSDVTYRVDVEKKLEESQNRLRRLPRRLLEVQEDERHRLAVELHERIGESLVAMKFLLSNFIGKHNGRVDAHVTETLAGLQTLIGDVRAMASELHPTVLDDLGLVPALLDLANWYRDTKGFFVSISHEGFGARLSADLEAAAYRIVQDGLIGVSRCPSADETSVDLALDNLVLTITLEYSGAMLDLNREGAPDDGLGMEGRARLLGGSMTAQSEIGIGNRITIHLPCGTGPL